MEEEKVSSGSEQDASSNESAFSGDQDTEWYAGKYQSTFWQKKSLQSTFSKCLKHR